MGLSLIVKFSTQDIDISVLIGSFTSGHQASRPSLVLQDENFSTYRKIGDELGEVLHMSGTNGSTLKNILLARVSQGLIFSCRHRNACAEVLVLRVFSQATILTELYQLCCLIKM